MRRGNETLDWSVLVPRLVHPTKVLILEAMLWIDRPLSASELNEVFEGKPDMSSISHHVRSLAGAGVLSCVGKHRVRGAWKRTYDLVASDHGR